MIYRFPIWYILLFSLLVLASGCANYRLGVVKPLIPSGYSIQVGLFQNTTIHPGLAESVNASIRRELQRDGTFELANSNNCDLQLWRSPRWPRLWVTTSSTPVHHLTPVGFRISEISWVNSRRATKALRKQQRWAASSAVVVV